ncbi:MULTISPECIES: hypothetical protein [unclassified Bacillus (in: firmicutes)]|uniref:hypothetical protein n=1 Tax=unclassified Bacillus (in: firmicutes) TaxID=185979 RepID=UPI0038351D58
MSFLLICRGAYIINVVTEIETSLWTICVGDVFSNGRMPYHLKVVNIEVEDMTKPDDAKILAMGMRNSFLPFLH